MGTGVVSSLLNTIPFHAHWLHYLSITFYILNVVLYSLAFSISLLRYTMYPETWTAMIHDPVNSLFLGAVPIGFASLIEMWLAICAPIWGDWTRYLAFGLWIVDAIVAAMVTLLIPILR